MTPDPKAPGAQELRCLISTAQYEASKCIGRNLTDAEMAFDVWEKAMFDAFKLGQVNPNKPPVPFPAPFDPEQEVDAMAEGRRKEHQPAKEHTLDSLLEASHAAMSDWIADDMGPEDKEYVLKQHATMMRHAYELGGYYEAKKEDGRLQTVLQHALNILVGFQLWAKGRTVFMGEDERTAVYANDLETATSVAELTKLARLADCQGLDLLPKPVDPPEMNVLSSGDLPLARGGGIFDG